MDKSCEKIKTAFVEFHHELTQQMGTMSGARTDLAEHLASLEKLYSEMKNDLDAQLSDHRGQMEGNTATIAAILDRVSRLEHENQALRESLASAPRMERQSDVIANPTSATFARDEVQVSTPTKDLSNQIDPISLHSTPGVPTDVPAKPYDRFSPDRLQSLAGTKTKRRMSTDELETESESPSANETLLEVAGAKRRKVAISSRTTPTQSKDEPLLAAYEDVNNLVEDGVSPEKTASDHSEKQPDRAHSTASALPTIEIHGKVGSAKDSGVDDPIVEDELAPLPESRTSATLKKATPDLEEPEEDTSPSNAASAETKRSKLLSQFKVRKGPESTQTHSDASPPTEQPDDTTTEQVVRPSRGLRPGLRGEPRKSKKAARK